ncbi:MAG: metallophosphoesterase [Lachnospiraceae bacterium]|nr:metallophosphoesterase [Lachnospiraceae bacterium]
MQKTEAVTKPEEAEKVDTSEKRKKRNRRRFWLIILVIFIISLPGYYCGLTVRKYEVQDVRIQGSIRIALVTDLHSCKYGKDQEKLLRAIDEQKPDLILLGGDIIDDGLPTGPAEAFLAGISGKYPIYYVTGNHECWAGKDNYLSSMKILESYEIKRLEGTCDVVTINGTTIAIGGIDDPYAAMVESMIWYKQLTDVKKEVQEKASEDTFTVLLSHRPESIEAYAQQAYDLVLAGHAHGGQWRIPGLINGMFAPDQGLFPKYAGGRYEKNKTTMIVSRGLARESTILPRFCNPPELVIVDLVGSK